MLALRNIPGLTELIEQGREVETETREDAWLGITRIIAGKRVRVMTVQDYTALLQFASPLLQRRLPTPDELAFFLWVLSPEIELWNERRGWRKWSWLSRLERRQSRRHGLEVRSALKLEELEEQEEQWRKKSKLPFVLPDSAPFTIAVNETFRYMDELFLDRPAGLKKDQGRSGLCYLTSWFDILQSEYHLPESEIWKMKIPVLFARLKAIQMRHCSKVPEFSAERDRIFQQILMALKQKRYTEEDLKAGRVDLRNNRLRDN